MKYCLPLYSVSRGDVCTRSGLNQGFAEGRPREYGEVYIPIPMSFYNKLNYNPFPTRGSSFLLHTNNSKTFNAKICQDNNKSLMSNPNKDLGKWLINDVLNITHSGVITFNDLINAKCDSVFITQNHDGSYTIEPAPLGAYNQFIRS